MTALRLWVRRSIGRPLAPALLAVVLLHIFARTRPWNHEWMWSVYQLNFVTVLLGPIGAGLGAWEGARLSSCRALVGSSNRVLQALTAAYGGVLAWVAGSYVVGLCVVFGVVKLAGTPGVPGVHPILTTLPALALLALQVATGVALGWFAKNPVAAPAAAIAWFLLVVYVYIHGPGQFVNVGGAGDSLVGLAPRTILQIAQVAAYLSLAALALLLAAHTLGWWRRYNPVVAPVSLVLSVTFVGILANEGPIALERDTPQLSCFGTNPEVCAAPGYSRDLAQAREALILYLSPLRSAGVAVPSRFAQGAEPGSIPVGPLSLAVLKGSRDEAGLLVMASYLRKKCDLERNPDVVIAHQYTSYWLFSRVTGRMPHDPEVPLVLVRGTVSEQRQWVRRAMSTIQQCGA